MIRFKERLKELRIEKELSQNSLANFIGVSQRSISSWETGFRRPDFEIIETLAKFFDVSTDYLLGLED